MNLSENHRFIERDYWYNKTLSNSENIGACQIDRLLDEASTEWNDLTFKFYQDGSVIIFDNRSNNRLSPKELSGACFDFYVRKRIQFIKADLHQKQLQYA